MSSIDLSSLLIKHGLLCHCFAYDDLPEHIKKRLGKENHSRYQHSYLSLLANAGPAFWIEMKASHSQNRQYPEALDNPVDNFSAKLVDQILQITELTTNAEVLYPGTDPAPLIQLGELANWSTPSPLGLGLHARYGPWFAYRALVKTTSALSTHSSANAIANNDVDHTGNYNSQSKESAGSVASKKSGRSADGKAIAASAEYSKIAKNSMAAKKAAKNTNTVKMNTQSSPCLSCTSTACVSACPGSAVSLHDSFNIARCADYRLTDNTLCEKQCHARNACPVGSEFRYSEEQREYHMTHALQFLAKWAKDN